MSNSQKKWLQWVCTNAKNKVCVIAVLFHFFKVDLLVFLKKWNLSTHVPLLSFVKDRGSHWGHFVEFSPVHINYCYLIQRLGPGNLILCDQCITYWSIVLTLNEQELNTNFLFFLNFNGVGFLEDNLCFYLYNL